MSNVTLFAPGVEVCTATINLVSSFSGEASIGPLHIGHYPTDDVAGVELWIEQEGDRISIPVSYVSELIKQLKRAQRIATDAAA